MDKHERKINLTEFWGRHFEEVWRESFYFVAIIEEKVILEWIAFLFISAQNALFLYSNLLQGPNILGQLQVT